MEREDYRDEMSRSDGVTLANELEDRLKRDILEGVKGSLGQFLDNWKESLGKSLRESGVNQNQILELLNDSLLGSEIEREKLAQGMEGLEETIKTALQEKVEVEKKLHEAKNINERLNTHLEACIEGLNEAVTLAEEFFRENSQLEDKLVQLQKNWERFVAN